MPSILITPPAMEPVTLDEARAFLRVEHYDDDDLIAALVTAARIHVETHTRRVLITQTWRVTADAWPRDGRLAVLHAPLQSVSAARVYDENNVAQTIDPQAFVVDVDLTGCTFDGAAIVWRGGALPLSSANGRIVVDALVGAVTVSIARDDTAAVPDGQRARLVLPIIDSLAQRSTLFIIPLQVIAP